MFIEDLKRYRIILASRSPRRQQMLKEMGISFEIILKDYPETYPPELSGREIAEYLSREKARIFRKEISDNEIVITADTIVWCNNEVLGKPADPDEARHMIRALSGNTHEVITGVTLLSAIRERTFSESTRVTFEMLTDEEINYYIDKYKPFDKAGAYGIQEWIGYAACSRIEGSYFNVVGLPVHRLLGELRSFIQDYLITN
jgi:septum formation protein